MLTRPRTPDDPPLQGADRAPQVLLQPAARLKPEPIDWMWPGWLAAGKLHILAGAPGTGKTTLAIALASVVSTAGVWPDGTRCRQPGNVLVWTGEDDPADTLVPRLHAHGASLDRVFFVGSVAEGGEHRPFDPARDIRALAEAAQCIGDVRLLICDPVVSAVTGDSHKNTEVRRALQPLVDLGHEIGCAVLGISHFSKGSAGRDPTERVVGSLAFGALARVVLAAAKVQDDGSEHAGRRILVRAKSNIGPDDGGFVYDLEQTELTAHPGIFASRVLWGEAIEGSAREILATADRAGDDDAGTSERADAERFLRDLLADGPVPARAIKADAAGAGYAWRTIERAKKTLGVEAAKSGFGRDGTWMWSLSDSLRPPQNPKDRQQKSLAVLAKTGGLSSGPDLVEIDI